MHRRDMLVLGAAGLTACAATSFTARGDIAPQQAALSRVDGSPRLQMRRLRAGGPPVLYIHGATFPGALSVGYRFGDGRSWEDALNAAGFDCWALDFEGFGGSARPAGFDGPAGAAPPILRSGTARDQIARAVRHVRQVRGDGAPVNIVAHSWGTIPAARFAAEHPDLVARLVLFGPVLQRPAPAGAALPPMPAWRLVTVEQQLARFISDVPAGQPPVLAELQLEHWGPAWLASDPGAAGRMPQAVKLPGGPVADLAASWSGTVLYDPERLSIPTMIVRGAWDSVCTDDDVAGFRAAFGAERRGAGLVDVVIPRATHLMHLEEGRFALYAATNAFLMDRPPADDAARVRPA